MLVFNKNEYFSTKLKIINKSFSMLTQVIDNSLYQIWKIQGFFLKKKKRSFLNFKEKHGKVVSKAIQRSARFDLMENERRIEFLCYTEEMSEEELPTYFFPTLFQKKLAKVFELRIFYLNENFDGLSR